MDMQLLKEQSERWQRLMLNVEVTPSTFHGNKIWFALECRTIACICHKQTDELFNNLVLHQHHKWNHFKHYVRCWKKGAHHIGCSLLLQTLLLLPWFHLLRDPVWQLHERSPWSRSLSNFAPAFLPCRQFEIGKCTLLTMRHIPWGNLLMSMVHWRELKML